MKSIEMITSPYIATTYRDDLPTFSNVEHDIVSKLPVFDLLLAFVESQVKKIGAVVVGNLLADPSIRQKTQKR